MLQEYKLLTECVRAARRGAAEPECVIELQRVYNKPPKLILALLVVQVPLPVLHAPTRARSFALMELRSGQRLGDSLSASLRSAPTRQGKGKPGTA